MQVERTQFQRLLEGNVQYVVPQWQRPYRWGKKEITRLADDLLHIANKESAQSHYGGTLILVDDESAAGLVRTVRVVDGQQRLTTVSLLINAIAKCLGPKGAYGWTQKQLQSLLINLDQPEEKRRKLRLQDGDEDKYRQCLETGKADGGSVADAYALIRKIVESNPDQYLKGLERFRVVRISLERNDNEDPQQIFESLNATGLRLAESDKVKNWLLMPLSDSAQKEIYREHWRTIERSLKADSSPDPIDLFLLDLLRWQTGELQGGSKTYERFQPWAKDKYDSDRPTLAADLARWACHYGILTGTTGSHSNRKVERELVHLRNLGLDIHRPFTLRLLDEEEQGTIDSSDVASTLRLVSTWLTRTWLADQQTAGYNRTFSEWASRKGPKEGEDVENYWREQLYSLQNTRSGVPTDEKVRDGIRTRKAYGGKASESAFAVLCRMVEDDHREESPSRKILTLEHVLPKTLTPAWRDDLGEQAKALHDKWRHRLANLTLSGAPTNARLSNGTFEEKKSIYRKSPIGLTRELADEDHWNEEALERRAASLAERALRLWPWKIKDFDHLPAKSQMPETIQRFWQVVQKETGGLLGQEDWIGPSQWSQPITPEKDRIGYGVSYRERQVFVYINRGFLSKENHRARANRTKAMLDFSQHIRNEITDQTLGVDEEKEAEEGRSIAISRDWDLGDESQWPETARWLKEQQNRLLAILKKCAASE